MLKQRFRVRLVVGKRITRRPVGMSMTTKIERPNVESVHQLQGDLFPGVSTHGYAVEKDQRLRIGRPERRDGDAASAIHNCQIGHDFPLALASTQRLWPIL